MNPTADVIPWFRLPDGAGGERGSADLLQRSDMLIALVHPGCDDCRAFLEELGRRQGALAERAVAPLAIVMAPPPAPTAGVPAAFDADGRARRLLAGALALEPDRAWLLVGDRFGEVRARFAVHGAEPGRLLDESLGWFEFVQEQCDECGVPEW